MPVRGPTATATYTVTQSVDGSVKALTSTPVPVRYTRWPPKYAPSVAAVAPTIPRATPRPWRPRRRAHHDAAYASVATVLIPACTSPTRRVPPTVSLQSDRPVRTVGTALSTPRPTSVCAAACRLRPPTRSSTHALVQK